MKNKNILFSTDGILGYKENVEEVLKEKFNIVEYIGNYFPLKSERTLYFKVLREIAKKSKIANRMYKKYVEKYYCNMLDKYKNIKFDYFLVVAGQEFSKEFIQELKRKNTKIKCILFLWDKLEYTTLANSVDEFDYIFSFDPDDCKKYGFIFRPSFYLDILEEKIISWNKRKYDIFYIGALRNKERYEIVERIYEYAKNNNLKYFLKLYVDKKNEKYLPKNYIADIVTKEKISYEENMKLMKDSRVVLDMNFSKQLGLTLRSIESIGSKTKVITTNNQIKEYDFYDQNNIYCLNNKNIINSLPNIFVTKKYEDIPNDIKARYTVNGFINEVFERIIKN